MVVRRRYVPIRRTRSEHTLEDPTVVVPRCGLSHRPSVAVLDVRRFRGDICKKRPLVPVGTQALDPSDRLVGDDRGGVAAALIVRAVVVVSAIGRGLAVGSGIVEARVEVASAAISEPPIDTDGRACGIIRGVAIVQVLSEDPNCVAGLLEVWGEIPRIAKYSKWPFFNTKSSFFRGNSPFSLHFQWKFPKRWSFKVQFAIPFLGVER